MPMKQAIAYYRVSTRKQGKKGLGLKAQEFTVRNHCKRNNLNIITEVVEVKSTRKFRIGLLNALELCKKNDCHLIVARLDRLGRDVEQIAGIIKSDIEIIIVDSPQANRFTLHILAAVAEDNRMKISENTKYALAAAKRRGVALGKNGKALSEANKKAAHEFANHLSPLLTRLRNKGIRTVRAVSDELNKRGIPTFRGVGRWHPSTVSILMNRLK